MMEYSTINYNEHRCILDASPCRVTWSHAWKWIRSTSKPCRRDRSWGTPHVHFDHRVSSDLGVLSSREDYNQQRIENPHLVSVHTMPQMLCGSRRSEYMRDLTRTLMCWPPHPEDYRHIFRLGHAPGYVHDAMILQLDNLIHWKCINEFWCLFYDICMIYEVSYMCLRWYLWIWYEVPFRWDLML
jgi:hypothetical protein